MLPNAADLVALEPEELAGPLLQFLLSLDGRDQDRHQNNFLSSIDRSPYPKDAHEAIKRALMEAWTWLEKEGLIALDPERRNDWFYVTKRGQQVGTPQDLAAYRHANLLPKKLLHPRLAQRVFAAFLRGDYDTAVFQSFKQVEVQVREAGGFDESDLGVDLMRRAFRPAGGPLSDPTSPRGERESLMHLFAGAIGSYKNPHSHRNVTIEAVEAVEMIMLASHLLNIIDRRSETAPDA